MIMTGSYVNRFLEPGSWACRENGNVRAERMLRTGWGEGGCSFYPQTAPRPMFTLRVPAGGHRNLTGGSSVATPFVALGCRHLSFPGSFS